MIAKIDISQPVSRHTQDIETIYYNTTYNIIIYSHCHYQETMPIRLNDRHRQYLHSIRMCRTPDLYSINDQFNLIRGQEEAESDAQNVVINIKSINRMERTDRALDQVMRTAGITDE